MKIAVFGLAISSSCCNGHARLWRGRVKAPTPCGHHVPFFERDIPYHVENPDLHASPGGELALYAFWAETADRARRAVADADVAIVTSACPDAVEAGGLARSVKAGTEHVGVGTFNGYRAALGLLGASEPPARHAAPLAHHGGAPPILAATRGPLP